MSRHEIRMRKFLGLIIIIGLVLLITGCGTVPPSVPVNVAIPIKCKAEVPERPVMPTENLSDGVSIDSFVQAAQAEIELREGYEVKLEAALRSCK
jgi:hypothetical protein